MWPLSPKPIFICAVLILISALPPVFGIEEVTFDEFADPETELTGVGDVLRSHGLAFTVDIGQPMDLINLAHSDTTGSPALYLGSNRNSQHYLHVAREDGKAFTLHALDLAKATVGDTSIPVATVMAFRDVSQNPVFTQSALLDGTSRVQNMGLNCMTDVTYVRIEINQAGGALVDAIYYDKKDQIPVSDLNVGFHYFYISGHEVDLDCYPLILGREYRVESSSDLATWTGDTYMAYQPRLAFHVYWPRDVLKRRFFRLSWKE